MLTYGRGIKNCLYALTLWSLAPLHISLRISVRSFTCTLPTIPYLSYYLPTNATSPAFLFIFIIDTAERNSEPLFEELSRNRRSLQLSPRKLDTPTFSLSPCGPSSSDNSFHTSTKAIKYPPSPSCLLDLQIPLSTSLSSLL